MGKDVDRTEFTARDYESFSRRVTEELEILRQLLRDPEFGAGPGSVGAELEFYIVDSDGFPAGINQRLLAEAKDSSLQPELNRFNIEANMPHYPLDGTPFESLAQDMKNAWDTLNQLARPHNARVTPIGILPTLRKSDFGPDSMTDVARYHALAEGLKRMRGGPFQVDIQGRESLHVALDDVTLEGANTSFQFHWRVPNRHFAETFNALQMVTPLTIAIGANSPFFLGHDLWDETRISLFKQSVDVRRGSKAPWREPARVDFGQGWLRHSAIELFELAVSLYPPLLPVVQEEDKDASASLPALPHLKLHHGTTWTWNRAIYDPGDGGHLRIELRAMPAGPTVDDMLATAAFSIGCAQFLRPHMDRMISSLPFKYAEYNFYAAARTGLAAQLVWPSPHQTKLRERPCTDIVQDLLEGAREGLETLGVHSGEATRLIHLIEARLDNRQNGADWQRRCVAHLEPTLNRKAACQTMFETYQRNQLSGKPVADWRIDP